MRALLIAILILVASSTQAWRPDRYYPTISEVSRQSAAINRQQDVDYYMYKSLQQQRRTNELLLRQARALEASRYKATNHPKRDVYMPGRVEK